MTPAISQSTPQPPFRQDDPTRESRAALRSGRIDLEQPRQMERFSQAPRIQSSLRPRACMPTGRLPCRALQTRCGPAPRQYHERQRPAPCRRAPPAWPVTHAWPVAHARGTVWRRSLRGLPYKSQIRPLTVQHVPARCLNLLRFPQVLPTAVFRPGLDAGIDHAGLAHAAGGP